MLTKRVINAGLPRVDVLRRVYRFYGQTGIYTRRVQTFKSAYMDPDGVVTVYAYGDAMARNHFYREGCIDVSELIADWIAGDIDRRDVVDVLHFRAQWEF